MGTLVLAGLGLCLRDMPMETLRAARRADVVFMETYTSLVPGLSPQRLQKLLGRTVEVIGRREMEDEGGRRVLSAAVNGFAVLLVPGDPLIATTHVTLVLDALKMGVKVDIIHASSIFSAAVGASGLQVYKFGPPATVTRPAPTPPFSTVEKILRNLERGLHTLLLLEIDVEKQYFMEVGEALEILLQTSREMGDGVSENWLIVVVGRAGCPDRVVKAGSISRLMGEQFGNPPYSIIIPGSLHPLEEESLMLMGGASREEVVLWRNVSRKRRST